MDTRTLYVMAGAIEVARETGIPVSDVLRMIERDAVEDGVSRDEATLRAYRRAMSGIEFPSMVRTWPISA